MSPQAGTILVCEVLPIIQRTVRLSVTPVGCEDHEELIADGILMAARMLEKLENNGQPLMSHSVAYYTLQRLKSGRRSYSAGRTDVLCPGAQLDQRSVLLSLDVGSDGDFDDDEELALEDMLAGSGEDVAMMAARTIDWQEVEAELSEQACHVIERTAEGHGTSAIAADLNVSPARISQMKREIGRRIKTRWGEDVIAVVAQSPAWKSSLHCVPA